MICVLVEVVKNINTAMAIKKFLVLSIFLLASKVVFCQNNPIYEEPGVKKVMEHYISIFKNKPYLEGWRVQIISTTDRTVMENIRSQVEQQFPDLSVKWEHTSPYFRIKLGAYPTKLLATQALYIIKKDYPTAYLVMDNKIEPKELFESGNP
ncbi:MAG: hypothetical protein RJA52_1428 [Bacteroidota bacterium]